MRNMAHPFRTLTKGETGMDHSITAKAGITVAFTAVATALGWKGILAAVWVACMALDYLSGTAAACKQGQWSSAEAREGLWHKGGMIVVVSVSGLADLVMALICTHLALGFTWSGLVLPLVLAWYIITELGSVLENAVKLGASVPAWLIRLMQAGKDAVDAAGDALDGQE